MAICISRLYKQEHPQPPISIAHPAGPLGAPLSLPPPPAHSSIHIPHSTFSMSGFFFFFDAHSLGFLVRFFLLSGGGEENETSGG